VRPTRPSLPLLTTLRFFAAAEVVAFHLAPFRPGEAAPSGFLSGLASGGHAAVVFFFVLSGFVLGYAHAGKTERTGCDVAATTFWRLRFARVAPAYYLALLLALPILAQVAAQSQASGWSLAAGMVSVLLLVQAWWPAYAGLWNFPAWSLSVECLFYALFPWLARTLARSPAWAVLAAAYGLVVGVGAYKAELLSSAAPSLFPLLHLPLFVIGMALARLHLFGPALPPKACTAMLTVGACLLVLTFGGAWLLPAWTRSGALLVPIFALIVLGAAGAAGAVPVLTRPAFMLLGEASYAIYILHIPLRYIWETTVGALLGSALWPWLDFLLYFAFVVLVSVVTFRHVEVPLRHWIAGARADRVAHPKRPAVGGAASGAGG
jgi:peptidoglycan/LPS O-acetylase OafA/YrhL